MAQQVKDGMYDNRAIMCREYWRNGEVESFMVISLLLEMPDWFAKRYTTEEWRKDWKTYPDVPKER